MEKHIFITNGTGGAGKDTFCHFVQNRVPTMKFSSIDHVKVVARNCGWDGSSKSEKDRKFLSDLKLLTSEYSDMPFRSIRAAVEDFNSRNDSVVMFIDIREPHEIERAKNEFGAKTILIRNDRVEPITSNMADANVEHYNYDFIIENNGTLEEFREKAIRFIDENIMSDNQIWQDITVYRDDGDGPYEWYHYTSACEAQVEDFGHYFAVYYADDEGNDTECAYPSDRYYYKINNRKDR